MRITIKLFATFREGRFAVEKREYAQGTKVNQIIEELNLPADKIGVILLNSRHVDTEHILEDGDTLSLFPLVGGG